MELTTNKSQIPKINKRKTNGKQKLREGKQTGDDSHMDVGCRLSGEI